MKIIFYWEAHEGCQEKICGRYTGVFWCEISSKGTFNIYMSRLICLFRPNPPPRHTPSRFNIITSGIYPPSHTHTDTDTRYWKSDCFRGCKKLNGKHLQNWKKYGWMVSFSGLENFNILYKTFLLTWGAVEILVFSMWPFCELDLFIYY